MPELFQGYLLLDTVGVISLEDTGKSWQGAEASNLAETPQLGYSTP